MNELTGEDILIGLVHHWSLSSLVPKALDLVDGDPLASGGWFRGDYVRALMEVPGAFWAGHPALYDRYRAALRANAATRRHLAYPEQAEFWSDLDSFLGERSGTPGTAPMPTSKSRTARRR